MNLGKQLSASTIQAGLRELNPDISFDAPVNRPGDYRFALDMHGLADRERQREERGGIYWLGNYIAPLDRGLVPEHRVWTAKDGVQEIPIGDAVRYENTKIAYKEIPPDSPEYEMALIKLERGDDNFTRTANGKVYYYQALRIGRVPDRIVRAGWRASFEALVAAGIPGITRRSLGAKFGVDMSPLPVKEIMLEDEYDGHRVTV